MLNFGLIKLLNSLTPGAQSGETTLCPSTLVTSFNSMAILSHPINKSIDPDLDKIKEGRTP